MIPDSLGDASMRWVREGLVGELNHRWPSERLDFQILMWLMRGGISKEDEYTFEKRLCTAEVNAESCIWE